MYNGISTLKLNVLNNITDTIKEYLYNKTPIVLLVAFFV